MTLIKLPTVFVPVRHSMLHATLRGLALLPLALLTNQCSSDDDPVSTDNVAGAAGTSAGSNHLGGDAGAGGARGGSTSAGGVTWAVAGAGGLAAGNAGALGSGGDAARYCRMTSLLPTYPFFQCPTDYCSALAAAIGISDHKLQIFEGATVRAGRCATSAGLDAVYFGGGVETTQCFYRAGAFVGLATWGDTEANVEGCRIFSGPVIYGEVPDSILAPSPVMCGALSSYRPLSTSSSGGAAGASGLSAGTSGVGAGTAGMASAEAIAGAAGAASARRCYQAATATCEPCSS